MSDEAGIPPTPPAPPAPEPPDEPPGPPPGDSGPAGNAWERREEVGFVAGLVEAVKGFVTAPGATFDETARSGDPASPVLFAVIISTAMGLVSQVWGMLFGASLLSAMPLPPEAEPYLGWLAATSGMSFFAVLFITPIFTVIGLFIGSAIIHLMLMMVGGLNSSESGFEGSLRAVAYGGSVAGVAEMIPIIGGFIRMIWAVILVSMGAMRMHGTSQGKAVAAVLLPLVFCCVCMFMIFFFGLSAALLGANG